MTSGGGSVPSDGQGVLDLSRLAILRELAGPADLSELAESYAVDAAAAIGAMRVAVAANELGNLVAIAHRFRGSCLTVGATRLAGALLDVEDRYAAARLEPFTVPLEFLAAEADAASRALRRLFPVPG
jgi:HPt (histidine-containing phosphotransfer) domain-containing protein